MESDDSVGECGVHGILMADAVTVSVKEELIIEELEEAVEVGVVIA